MIQSWLVRAYQRATELNRQNILHLLTKNTEAHILDLGCDDGTFSCEVAHTIGTSHLYGVEIDEAQKQRAEAKGLLVKVADLNAEIPFADAQFDVVCANQVIEHLHDTDRFLAEIFRILKPGGYAIISTENASSWCNIGATLFGWQPFSLTNFSQKALGLGNPFALHGNEPPRPFWLHTRIYTIYGLCAYAEAFSFCVETVRGAGYFPFPAFFGKIDKTHSHFLALRLQKHV